MKFLNCILFICVCFSVNAQEYGIQWVLGYKESVLDFRNDTLTNYAIGPVMPLFLTLANICDSSGDLLYYTNGIYVAGANGDQIMNGDSLSPGDYTNQYACCGLNIPQGVLFLPMPGNSRYYYLFHSTNDTLEDTRPATLYYSVIDMEANNGNGAIISKNVIYYKGFFREGGITACRHANGRDWWIVIGDNNNTYYKFLFTPNGISDTLTQTIGPSFNNSFNIAYSKFSVDGTKYVTGCGEGPVLVMDFDRCSGEFSNPDSIFNYAGIDTVPVSGSVSVEFSPNGRFVYVSDRINLNQYDLLSADVQDSATIYSASDTDEVQIHFLQLAPNGKIYGSCWNGGFYVLHVLNNPDAKGDSCNFVYGGLTTLTISTVPLPNMINYNLGSLAGPCDTIYDTSSSINEQLPLSNLIRLLPNPADKYLYVEVGTPGNYEFDLLNAMGQIVAVRETRQVDIFDTEGLASGVYFLRATNRNNRSEVAARKVVVEH